MSVAFSHLLLILLSLASPLFGQPQAPVTAAPRTEIHWPPSYFKKTSLEKPLSEATPLEPLQPLKPRALKTGRRAAETLSAQKVAPPRKAKKSKKAQKKRALAASPLLLSAPSNSAAAPLPSKFLMLQATTYAGRKTHLEFQGSPRQEPARAWSNLNWDLFKGFSSFTHDGVRWSFLMLHSTSTRGDLRRSPRLWQESRALPRRALGASYLLSTGEDELVLDFLEATHQLYEDHARTLKKAHRKRTLQKTQRLKTSSDQAAPEPFTIQFWDTPVQK